MQEVLIGQEEKFDIELSFKYIENLVFKGLGSLLLHK